MIKRDLFIMLGSLCTAVSIRFFLLEHEFISGGISGIALMIQYLLRQVGFEKNILGLLIFVINIPIFIVGYRFIDRDFIVRSLVGMASLTVIFLPLVSRATNFLRVDDPMLAAIYAGVLSGVGAGIILKNRGSQGGTDIIAFILKKYYSVNIGTVLFGFNLVIVLIASVLFGVERGMYTLIAMFVSSAVLDKVIAGFDRRKALFIITSREEEVAHKIMKDIGRGVTILQGEGAFTHYEKKVLYTIVSLWQLAKVKYIVEQIDENAFISVMDAAEVLGNGFKPT